MQDAAPSIPRSFSLIFCAQAGTPATDVPMAFRLFSHTCHRSPSMPVPRIVIVGAGFGGLSAAHGLAGTEADVAVIDRRNYHLFQPLLYQVATAGLSPAQIASP